MLTSYFRKTIELGHQGEPVTDVILRIYRYDDNKKRYETLRNEGIKKLSARTYVTSDCEEVFFF